MKAILIFTFFIVNLSSCVYFWDEPLFANHLTKDFVITGRFECEKEGVMVCWNKERNTYGGMVVVKEEVISIGYNDDFIIAKRRPGNKEDAKVLYYIIDLREYDQNESYQVLDFENRDAFQAKFDSLNIPTTVQFQSVENLELNYVR